MTFQEALEKLNITDFEERIMNSNSHGELFHVLDYISIAETAAKPEEFRALFLDIVAFAERSWNRPESVFQHMPKMLNGGG